MTPLLLPDLLAATGGELRGDVAAGTRFARIERDGRRAGPGDLFIAITGEQHDGHRFVEQAAVNGASAALVSAAWAAGQAEPPLPLIVVDESVAALQRLAGAWRDELGDRLTVVGITGSVGKTSTKEVVASVLGGRFETYRSPGNLNNEIGLPLSVLEIGRGTEAAVLEMGGAYAFGELRLLAGIAKPRIAVVTNVYPVHLERMGSLAAIAETKAELVEAVPVDGVAVLNGDDPLVRAMASRCRGRVLFYGLDTGNDVRGTDVVSEALEGTTFWLHLAGERAHIKVPLVGGHAVDLALAGLAVGHALGMDIGEMLLGLKDPAVQVRLLVMPGPRGARLIDDTYNASTPSVLSALGLLASLQPKRAIAVLGDMRELGSLAEEEHRVVGRRAGEVADRVVTFGELAKVIGEEARGAAGRVDGRPPVVQSFGLDQRGDLIGYLLGVLREGDVVLLKGSRGLMMEDVVAALRADVGEGAPPAPADGRAAGGP
jgi:UDP-N-acetylmuramoyl-tripeptide--D-alanyl-D-alanine ligase